MINFTIEARIAHRFLRIIGLFRGLAGIRNPNDSSKLFADSKELAGTTVFGGSERTRLRYLHSQSRIWHPMLFVAIPATEHRENLARPEPTNEVR